MFTVCLLYTYLFLDGHLCKSGNVIYYLFIFCTRNNREIELTSGGVTGGIKGRALTNDRFWAEWSILGDHISPELKDMFNRIFVMEPNLRLPLRDILRHPWVNVKDGLSSGDVQQDMMARLVN